MKGVFNLEVGGGQTIKDGKTHYPHFVRVRIPNERLLNVVTRLIKDMEGGGPGELDVFGELTRDAEEDNGNELSTK